MTTTTDEKVWVLIIEHRHGTSGSVHRSEDSANEALHDWVEEWWEHEVGHRPMSDDPEEAILEYFELVEDESFMLTEAEIND